MTQTVNPLTPEGGFFNTSLCKHFSDWYLKQLGHFFRKIILFHNAVQYKCDIYETDPVQWIYLVRDFVTDGLVLQHQGISSHITEYIPMCFQLYMG